MKPIKSGILAMGVATLALFVVYYGLLAPAAEAQSRRDSNLRNLPILSKITVTTVTTEQEHTFEANTCKFAVTAATAVAMTVSLASSGSKFTIPSGGRWSEVGVNVGGDSVFITGAAAVNAEILEWSCP